MRSTDQSKPKPYSPCTPFDSFRRAANSAGNSTFSAVSAPSMDIWLAGSENVTLDVKDLIQSRHERFGLSLGIGQIVQLWNAKAIPCSTHAEACLNALSMDHRKTPLLSKTGSRGKSAQYRRNGLNGKIKTDSAAKLLFRGCTSLCLPKLHNFALNSRSISNLPASSISNNCERRMPIF
jgi:hypothetical protein